MSKIVCKSSAEIILFFLESHNLNLNTIFLIKQESHHYTGQHGNKIKYDLAQTKYFYCYVFFLYQINKILCNVHRLALHFNCLKLFVRGSENISLILGSTKIKNILSQYNFRFCWETPCNSGSFPQFFFL